MATWFGSMPRDRNGRVFMRSSSTFLSSYLNPARPAAGSSRRQEHPAQDAMLAKKPEVARPSHRRSPGVNLRQRVFLIEAATVQIKIDLAHLEATDLEID